MSVAHRACWPRKPILANAPFLMLAGAIAWTLAAPARAADPLRCLSPEQRRAAITNHQAMPLGRAIRTVRGRVAGEVVRARLCESPGGLVYMLTVLARDGKVTRTTVDAVSGNLLGGR